MTVAHTHVVPRPGESAPFHFTTRWRFTQPSAQVWEVFRDIGHWHEWWPGVHESTALNDAAHVQEEPVPQDARKNVTAGPDDERSSGEGAEAALIVHRPLVRDLHLALLVSGTEPPVSARVDVTGDLRGHGHWHATDDDGGCRVEIVWCVVTRSRTAKIARGASAWAHRRVMDGGLNGLRERLAGSAPRQQ